MCAVGPPLTSKGPVHMHLMHLLACMQCVCVWGWPTISERERDIYIERGHEMDG